MRNSVTFASVFAFLALIITFLVSGDVTQTGISAQTPRGPVLHLRSRAFDPLSERTPALALSSAALTAGGSLPELFLVQFTGPIQDAWYQALLDQGLQIISYLPDYAYLVWGAPQQMAQLAQAAPTRWIGAYRAEYALHPALYATRIDATQAAEVTLQVVDDAVVAQALEIIQKQALSVLSSPHRQLNTWVLSLRLAPGQLENILATPGLVNLEPYRVRHKLDEVQGQIIAGNLDATGHQPQGPGYLDWLLSKGFSTNALDYPVVDITDDGIDNGSDYPEHPDFYYLGDSGQLDRLVYNVDWTNDARADGRAGHGNLNASIVAGYNQRSGSLYEDAQGFNYGLGINPFGRIAGSKIFNNAGVWELPGDNYAALVAQTYRLGGRISSNSWGAASRGDYTVDDQAYDILARDAVSAVVGNQPLVLVFSAGNDGRDQGSSTGSPGNAKNVITVGASESYRPAWKDGCNVDASGADDIQQISDFSSRGPTLDGRAKPELLAPGTHIQAAASQVNGYTGSGICDVYRPQGQTLYSASSGTSHAAPAVAGAAALFYRYYQDHYSSLPPSPAMVKAYLVNSARYLTGAGADTLPSPHQGFGGLDLGRAFDSARRTLLDQTRLLTDTGEVYTLRARVSDPAGPVRVTLAWTDAPGPTFGDAYVNNLNLEVEVGGKVYLGNVFTGAISMTGGAADLRNNVESVYLPAGQRGDVTVRVRAANLAGDGVPGNADTTDQDFALVVYNGQEITGNLNGKVVNDAGNVLAETIVQATTLGADGARTFRAQVSASGQYTLALPGGIYAVSAWKYGYTRAETSDVVIANDQTARRDFVLNAVPVYPVSGCVTDRATGQGLAARLDILGPFDDLVAQSATTQVQPCYRLDLPAGQYQASVVSRLHELHAAQIHVSNSLVHDFQLDATTTDGLLSGQIIAHNTVRPVANASVQLRSTDGSLKKQIVTDASGRYETMAAPGNYTVTVSAPFYTQPPDWQVIIPQSNLVEKDFSLASAAALVVPDYGIWSHRMSGQESRRVDILSRGTGPLSFLVYAVYKPFLYMGPDAYGYTALDSRSSTGVRYEWLDPAGATQVVVADEGEVNLALPFAFTFYGQPVNTLRLSNNGAIQPGVTTGDIPYANSALGALTLNNVVAPFWDDLDASNGWIAYETLGEMPERRFVITWYNRPHFQRVGGITFQVIFYEGSNNLKFQYQDVEFGNANFDHGRSATVGIAGSNTYYLQYLFEKPNLENGMALCFQAAGASPCDPEDVPWLKIVQGSSGLLAGQSQQVNILLDAADLSDGIYTAQVRIASNDPAKQPAVVLPVTFVVGEVSLYLPVIHK